MATTAAAGTPPRRGRAILARAALLTVGLALLITGAIILLLVASSPFGSFYRTGSPLEKVTFVQYCGTGSLPSGVVSTAKRTTSVVATDTALTIQVDLALPRDLTCAKAIQNDVPPEYRTLVARMIGPILVNGSTLSPPRDHPSEVSFDSGARLVHVRVNFRHPINQSAILEIRGPAVDSAIRPSRDSLHLALNRMRASPVPGLGPVRTDTSLVLVDSTSRGLPPYELQLTAVVPRAASITPAGEMLRRIAYWDAPGLSELLSGLGAALPLLLLIWVATDGPRQGAAVRIAGVSTSFVVFLLAVAAMSALSRVTFATSDLPIIGDIEAWRRQYSMTFAGREVAGSAEYFIAPVLGVLVSGALIREGAHHPESRRVRRLANAALGGALVIGLAFDIFLFARSPVPLGAWQLAALILAIATLWAALAILSKALWPSLGVSGAIAGTVATILLFALIDRNQYVLDPWLQIPIWFTITASIGLLTMTALWWRTRTLLNNGLSTVVAMAPAPAAARRALRTFILAALIVGVMPLGLFLREQQYGLESWFHTGLPFSVISALLWYVYPLWIACVLVALYAEGNASIRVEPATRAVAVIAGASAVFPTSQGWLSAPVSFLIGVATLWFVSAGKDQERSFALPVDEAIRRRSIRALRRLRGAELSCRAFRRKQYDAFVKGDIDQQTYDRTVAERFDQLDTLGVTAKVDGQDPRDVALAMPLYASAWRNGLYGTAWSFVAAFPWIALGVIAVLRQATDPTYPLIAIEGAIFRTIIKWAAIGFLFGYLFPYIKGTSGLAKGLSLSVAIGAVYILGALPIASSADWQASIFLATQILIVCLVLGLGFDYMALRRAGERDWRVLFELHGMPAVGASISSILVAAGGSVVALLNSHTLVNEVVRLLFPKLPAAFLGGSP